MIAMLAVVAVILAIVFGYKAFVNHMTVAYMAARAAAPQVVSTTVATTTSWPTEISAVASLHPVQGADLSVEVTGIVESIDFKPGDDVKAGAPLIHLRAADDIAKLHALEATARLAAVTYERDKRQFAAKAVSQAVLDTDAATLESDAADVAQQQALVEKKIVRAPFAGRVGINQVNVGQYVNAGMALVTLQAVDPIYADFTLPQQDLSRLSRARKFRSTLTPIPSMSSRGRSWRSIPAWIWRRATFRSARNSPTRTTYCCPACMRR
jgi:membrane fusion protein (multidrug efflux system)